MNKNEVIALFFKYLGKVPYPFCDKCDNRVRKLYAEATSNALERSCALYVECHGDKQLVLKAQFEAFPFLSGHFKDGWRTFTEEGLVREQGILVPGDPFEIKKEGNMACKSKKTKGNGKKGK